MCGDLNRAIIIVHCVTTSKKILSNRDSLFYCLPDHQSN